MRVILYNEIRSIWIETKQIGVKNMSKTGITNDNKTQQQFSSILQMQDMI